MIFLWVSVALLSAVEVPGARAEGRGVPPAGLARVVELNELAGVVTDQSVRLEVAGSLTQVTLPETGETFGVPASRDEVIAAVCLTDTVRPLKGDVILCYAR